MSRWSLLAALGLLTGVPAACAVDDDSGDGGGATEQTCAALDDASMVSPDQVGAVEALSAAATSAPPELLSALRTLEDTAREIEALDPTGTDTATQVSLILTDPAVGSAQSTVRAWLNANCTDG